MAWVLPSCKCEDDTSAGVDSNRAMAHCVWHSCVRNAHKLHSQRLGMECMHKFCKELPVHTEEEHSSAGKGLVKACRSLLKLQRLWSSSHSEKSGWINQRWSILARGCRHPRWPWNCHPVCLLSELCSVSSSPGQLLNRTTCYFGWLPHFLFSPSHQPWAFRTQFREVFIALKSCFK